MNKHIHKLQRVFHKNRHGKLSFYWECVDRGCKFKVWNEWMETIIVIDRICECWECDNTFALQYHLATMDKPVCPLCFERKMKVVK